MTNLGAMKKKTDKLIFSILKTLAGKRPFKEVHLLICLCVAGTCQCQRTGVSSLIPPCGS